MGLTLKEYRTKFPELYRETMGLLEEHKDVIKELKRTRGYEPSDELIPNLSRLDLQTRIQFATEERRIEDGGSWIPILYPDVKDLHKKDRYGHPMGASLDDTTEAQRNAFMIQQWVLAILILVGAHWL